MLQHGQCHGRVNTQVSHRTGEWYWMREAVRHILARHVVGKAKVIEIVHSTHCIVEFLVTTPLECHASHELASAQTMIEPILPITSSIASGVSRVVTGQRKLAFEF